MYKMFYHASAFDQDLVWCVADDVVLDDLNDPGDAFFLSGCASTSCGVLNTAALACGGAMSDSTIRTAVWAWLADATAAEATYGHISTWATGGVTDMSKLFCAYSSWSVQLCQTCLCNTAATSFNEDIGVWDTSGVTTMYAMFADAESFNQDLSDWAVHSVTDMDYMFASTLAFDQDIGAWDTSGVTTMYLMFEDASSFNQDIGAWDT